MPAVEGTRNVLASCTKAGVTRVALTASTACVYVVYGTTPEDHVFTEHDWSPEDMLRTKKNWCGRATARPLVRVRVRVHVSAPAGAGKPVASVPNSTDGSGAEAMHLTMRTRSIWVCWAV